MSLRFGVNAKQMSPLLATAACFLFFPDMLPEFHALTL